MSVTRTPTQSGLCCPPPAVEIPLSLQEITKLAGHLKAIADPVRLQILTHLLDQVDQESCTCILAPIVRLSEPTVSHHLKKLEISGILTKERRGMSVYYRVVPEAIHSIAQALHIYC